MVIRSRFTKRPGETFPPREHTHLPAARVDAVHTICAELGRTSFADDDRRGRCPWAARPFSGWVTGKVHLPVGRRCRPLSFVLTVGQALTV